MIDKRMLYSQGQRVTKSLDGSRPGYGGGADMGTVSTYNPSTKTGVKANTNLSGGYQGGEPGGMGDADKVGQLPDKEKEDFLKSAKKQKEDYLTGVGQSQLQHLYDTPQKFKGIFGIPTPFSIGANLASPFLHKMKQGNIDFFRNKVLKGKNRAGYTDTIESYKEYMKNRLGGFTDAYGNTHPNYMTDSKGNYLLRGGGHDNIMQEEVIDDDTTDDTTDDELILRFLGADSTLDPAAAGLASTDELRNMLLERAKNLYT